MAEAAGGEAAVPMSVDARMAKEQFEAANSVRELSADEMYKFDQIQDEAFREQAAWTTDPHYFKHVKMSALALLKLLMHARKGGDLEVMGLLQGKFDGDTMIVMDVYALPVEGTETRVGASESEEAFSYMFAYQELMQRVGREERVMGWYHSHPGYGCWLSGIDVTTQRINQSGQDPFVAIVIDPKRTCTSGKVDVGAFRVWPEGYTPPGGTKDDGFQSIPESKIEDFGVHANAYYQMDIEFFKSPLDKRLLDLMWNKYWVNTLASSPLLMNAGFVTGQIADLTSKLETAERQLSMTGRSGRLGFSTDGKKKQESKLAECVRTASKTSIEVVSGLATQLIKEAIFNTALTAAAP